MMFLFSKVKSLFLVFLILLFVGQHAYAVEPVPESQTEISLKEQHQKVLLASLAGIGVVTAWGVIHWDYFSQSPDAQSEGWFSNDTDYGGADKFGHMYTSYLTTHILAYLYEKWDLPSNRAAFWGSLSSFLILGYMEFGDSFSPYGFSYEDLISNGIGNILGYVLYRYPSLSDKIDFRWEYGFNPNQNDFVTDYENSKYLFAFKLNGFAEMKSDNFLKHIEFLLGYYTRGFESGDEPKERNMFVGVGFNFTDQFRRSSFNKTATVLKYIQIPYTYQEYTRNLND